MMFKPPTVEEVDAELEALQLKLREYNRLIARQGTLLEYKAVLARLNPNGAETFHKDESASSESKAIETAEVARQILSGVAQMSERDLAREAVRLGWKGSGSETTDARRFYVSMYRQKHVFEKVPGVAGTWRLKK